MMRLLTKRSRSERKGGRRRDGQERPFVVLISFRPHSWRPARGGPLAHLRPPTSGAATAYGPSEQAKADVAPVLHESSQRTSLD